jgi:hypothetical protein
MGIGAKRTTQFVIPEEQRIRDALLSGCSSLVIVLPVLDVVAPHDFCLAQIGILFPLKIRLSNGTGWREEVVRSKNRLF